MSVFNARIAMLKKVWRRPFEPNGPSPRLVEDLISDAFRRILPKGDTK